jgi:regulator of protease activity HflC (stomatin/prohibitin superfamily)
VTAALVALIIVLCVAVALAGASVRILREYERAVVFRLGRLLGAKGPGIVVLIPGVDRMVRVDLRTVTLDVPPQDLITRDNVPAKVNAVAYYRVIDPVRSIVEVERYHAATSQIAQTTLRSVLGRAELDMLLSERDRLNEALQQIIDEQTDPWGVKVSLVEIKDVGIPQGMQRAMARQAEAERERRAKVINAEGEFQAAERLRDAADIMSGNPATLQLRYMQTLLELGGGGQSSTIVFPIPIDLIGPLLSPAQQAHNRDGRGAAREHSPEQPAPSELASEEPPSRELPLDAPPPKELVFEQPPGEELGPQAPQRHELAPEKSLPEDRADADDPG